MELDFLAAVHPEIADFVSDLTSQHLGSKVALHTEGHFPELGNVRIAIIGVLENRGAITADQPVQVDHIRRELYKLYPGNWSALMADLGDLHAGSSIEDTYFALRKVVGNLIKRNIIPIVIGGSQDLTYPLYRSYDQIEQMVNLVSIDSRFDFGNYTLQVDDHSYLSRIVLEEPNNLFNYSNIGFQTYYNPQEEIDLIEKLFFDAYRLGDMSANIAISEPVFRDADLVSIDLTSVKSCESGNFTIFTPNGFSGKEICALSRYAGISDRVSMLGLFNHQNSAQEAVLISQIVWYFIEGVNYRSGEYPFGSKENYLKYIVPHDDEQLVFYKSDRTDRWWIEIPFNSGSHNKLKRNTLLPCSYEDYLGACNQELPERWWKAQRKNVL